jgi:hypothetical protein
MKNSKAITKVKEELETKNSYNMGDYWEDLQAFVAKFDQSTWL